MVGKCDVQARLHGLEDRGRHSPGDVRPSSLEPFWRVVGCREGGDRGGVGVRKIEAVRETKMRVCG